MYITAQGKNKNKKPANLSISLLQQLKPEAAFLKVLVSTQEPRL